MQLNEERKKNAPLQQGGFCAETQRNTHHDSGTEKPVRTSCRKRTLKVDQENRGRPRLHQPWQFPFQGATPDRASRPGERPGERITALSELCYSQAGKETLAGETPRAREQSTLQACLTNII